MIFFGYVDFYAKIFIILYPLLENSTTRIAITETEMTTESSSSKTIECLKVGIANGTYVNIK